jgi:hypothetical protein
MHRRKSVCAFFREFAVLNGLYKVEYGIDDAFGRSIMCLHDGKMLGGNSAFAHLGTYRQIGDEIEAPRPCPLP